MLALVGLVTVLLHAAPVIPGRVELEPDDISTLTSSLDTLVQSLPAKSVRVVVFRLDERTILLEKDAFQKSDLDLVTKLLKQTKPGVVDYQTLQTHIGSFRFAEGLLKTETTRAEAPSAMIFLGPYTKLEDDPKPPKTPAGPVKLFYVQYREPLPRVQDPNPLFGPNSPQELAHQQQAGGRAGTMTQNPDVPQIPLQHTSPRPPHLPDALEILVKARSGEVISVDTPNAFASATKKIAAKVK